jgi:hypothetical protein
MSEAEKKGENQWEFEVTSRSETSDPDESARRRGEGWEVEGEAGKLVQAILREVRGRPEVLSCLPSCPLSLLGRSFF